MGWIEGGPVAPSGGYGYLNRIVDVKDNALGAVLAESLLVLAADNGKGVHDVGDGVARGGEKAFEFRKLRGSFVVRASFGATGGPPAVTFVGGKVQVEEGSVELATEEEAAIFVPTEGWTVVAAVVREGFEVPCGAGEFEDPIRHPGADRSGSIPGTCFVEHLRQQRRTLIHQVEIQVDAAYLLPDSVVEYEGTQIRIQDSEVRGVLGAEQHGHTIPHTRPREYHGVHRPFVRKAGHIREPEQPIAIPQSAHGLGTSTSIDPIQRNR